MTRSFNYAEAVRLRAEGLTAREIASRLYVSVGSVHRAWHPSHRDAQVAYSKRRRAARKAAG